MSDKLGSHRSPMRFLALTCECEDVVDAFEHFCRRVSSSFGEAPPARTIVTIVALFRRQTSDTTLVPADSRVHQAICREIAAVRPWFDPKSVRWGQGEPFVWLWATPITGIMIIREPGGDWLAQPMGYDRRGEPKRLGLTSRRIGPGGSGGLSTKTIAHEVIGQDVVHLLATYVSLPPKMWVRGYDRDWASNELMTLGMDGWVLPPE